jgi:hypothetical protein
MSHVIPNKEALQSMRNFTLEDGIKVQTKQLEVWSLVLNYYTMKKVIDRCEELNEYLRKEQCNDGYRVMRGNEITCYIQNISENLWYNNNK